MTLPAIRPETAADHDAIRQVHHMAFGREDEANLVDALRDGGFLRLSLVAEKDDLIVGHILFSDLPVVTQTRTIPAVALAPMAVLPEFQNQGIGSSLVRRGLEFCQDRRYQMAIVLGHPHFYRRFGFSSELAARLDSPFSGESFMAVELVNGVMGGTTGRVEYPEPFGRLS